jgi:hypothetical protein
VIQRVGDAEASKTRAVGLATAEATQALGEGRARGYAAQVQSLGAGAVAAVAVADAVAQGQIDIMPDVLVTGGGGAFEGLAAVLMRTFGDMSGRTNGKGSGNGSGVPPAASAPELDVAASDDAVTAQQVGSEDAAT